VCTRRKLDDADSGSSGEEGSGDDADDNFWYDAAVPVVLSENAVATVASVKSFEKGSYHDGFAAYAQFFQPMGIAVTGAGSTLWIGDYGNNRIRNITCSSLTAPTFSPTALPTHTPTARPTAAPTLKPVVGKAKTGKGKGGTGAGKTGKGGAGGKAGKGKAGKAGIGASVSATDSSSTYSSLSVTAIVLISVFSFVGAIAAAYLLYYRKNIMKVVLQRGEV
jgi:hypothetical protein